MKSFVHSLLAVVCTVVLASSGWAQASKKSAPANAPATKAPAPHPASPVKSAFDKPTFETYIRHLFVWGPQITVQIGDPKPSAVAGLEEVTVRASAGQASQDETFLVSKDGRKIVKGLVFDVGQNPFKPELDKLKTQFQPSMGTPGAPVVIVVFTDFQCPFCKEEAKMLRQNLLSAYPKQVRLYFKDFPLTQIHDWSRLASIAGRCIFRQNPAAFWDYHDWVYEHQTDIRADTFKDKLMEFAKGKEIDVIQLSRCLETRETEPEVDKSVAEGQVLMVRSTPTVFVNGRRLEGNVPWPNLRDIIDFEIKYQETAKNAGEDCGCEIKLPSPLN